MQNAPLLPSNAPFSAEQRAWINGYIAGLFSSNTLGASDAPAALPAPRGQQLLVMYGSQTGTADGLAKRVGKEATKLGHQAQVLEMSQFSQVDWAKQTHLLLVCSTWGDGEPPDNAAGFWEFIRSQAAPKLGHLKFGVLALGDRNYSDFCGAGKKFDTRLAELAAQRMVACAECDVDYEATAIAWMESLWTSLKSEAPTSAAVIETAPATVTIAASTPAHTTAPTGRVLAQADLVTNQKLTGGSGAKDTRHLEISVRGTGLRYEAGDALGILPRNCPQLVDDVLKALNCSGDESLDSDVTLRDALSGQLQINRIPTPLLESMMERTGDDLLKEMLNPEHKARRDDYLKGRDVLDLLVAYPKARFEPRELAGLLPKLHPRLYSISSSPRLFPEEVHLTVGVVRYEAHGRMRNGVCSTFLADRAAKPLSVFVQKSSFRLPTDGDRPVIMVGPGTGIAPFRAFLQERKATQARGQNWLFFGNQSAATDFLYREELAGMQREGLLTRMDTAFSRDQSQKIYVQHRIRENAAEMWDWLERGAHLYVCGDASRMAKDVDAALHDVIKAAGRSEDQARAYVQELKTAKRYQRDVY